MKTIFTDFDGTITNQKGELLDSTLKELYKISKKFNIVIVTGRPVSWGQFMIHTLPIKHVIAENGYCIITKNDKIYPFGKDLYQEKIINIINNNFSVDYSPDQESRESDVAILLNNKFLNNQNDIINLLEKNKYTYKISNIHFNVWKNDYNKGSAIKWYIKNFNLNTSELYAIGDSPNDQPMFDIIDESYQVLSNTNFNLNTKYKINEFGGLGFNIFSKKLMPEKHSYITLVTNNFYVKCAMVLIHSLKKVSNIPIIVMVSNKLDNKDIKKLEFLGGEIIKIDSINFNNSFLDKHNVRNIMTNKPYTADKFGAKKSINSYNIDNFMKLKLWELTNYTKLAYLDADILVLKNMDSIFKFEEFSVSTNLHVDIKQLGKINSGVFIAKPSKITFDKMIDTLNTSDKIYERTDQTFLEEFFPNPYIIPHTYNCLQYLNCISENAINFDHIYNIHYIIDKPWDVSKKHHDNLKHLHDIWWKNYNSIVLPERLR